jgi:hypothetical protein
MHEISFDSSRSIQSVGSYNLGLNREAVFSCRHGLTFLTSKLKHEGGLDSVAALLLGMLNIKLAKLD